MSFSFVIYFPAPEFLFIFKITSISLLCILIYIHTLYRHFFSDFTYLFMIFFNSVNILKKADLMSLTINLNVLASSGMVSIKLFCFYEEAILYCLFVCFVIFCWKLEFLSCDNSNYNAFEILKFEFSSGIAAFCLLKAEGMKL